MSQSCRLKTIRPAAGCSTVPARPRLTPSFASHRSFAPACHGAHIRLRVMHERLIALVETGHGIALPSAVRSPRAGVSVALAMHRDIPLGQWTVAALPARGRTE